MVAVLMGSMGGLPQEKRRQALHTHASHHLGMGALGDWAPGHQAKLKVGLFKSMCGNSALSTR